MLTTFKKKLAVASMGVVLVAGSAVPTFADTAEKTSFPDVPEDHQYYTYITDLAEANIVDGYEDGNFKMGAHMQRAQVAKMVSLMVDLDLEASKAPFKDVKQDVWYSEYINALYDGGYIKGYDDETFEPKGDITRAEFANMVFEAYDLEAAKADLPFKDLKDDVWYSEAIETLYALGVINGQETDKFSPKANMKRGDAAKLLAEIDYAIGDKLPKPTFTLDLMHTGDTHAHLNDKSQNVAQRVTAVETYREDHPDALLLDSGDVFSGTLYFNEYFGQADMAFMNMMEYDAMVFGNHEFDLGEKDGNHKKLAAFVTAADFPFVSSNVDFSEDYDLNPLVNKGIPVEPKNNGIYNGIVKEVNGEQIGIFGLTTEETENIASPLKVRFEDYIAEAKATVTKFEDMGVDKIIALTHIGLQDNPEINDIKLAQSVDGIDVIFGGHSHTKLDEAVLITEDGNGEAKDPTLINHTFQYGEFVGTLNVEFDKNGVIVGHADELLKVADYDENEEARALLDKYSVQIDKIMEEEIGVEAVNALENPRSEEPGEPSVRNSETVLGNLITDGMLREAKSINPDTVLALQNGGGIRTHIDAGPITTGEVMEVLPFGNTLSTMELSGAEIREALEHSVATMPNEFGGFLHVSGMKYTYDSSQEAGDRVQTVQVDEEGDGTYVDLDADKTYVVATNFFTAKGGDGYTTFEKAYEEGRVTDLGSSDWENFRNHLIYVAKQNDGKIDQETEDRIVDVAK